VIPLRLKLRNWGPFLTLTPRGEVVPQGYILSPRWSYTLGVKFSVLPSILLNSGECSPLG
jgi:hypothetical protein